MYHSVNELSNFLSLNPFIGCVCTIISNLEFQGSWDDMTSDDGLRICSVCLVVDVKHKDLTHFTNVTIKSGEWCSSNNSSTIR
jgi:hypothetical protein